MGVGVTVVGSHGEAFKVKPNCLNPQRPNRVGFSVQTRERSLQAGGLSNSCTSLGEQSCGVLPVKRKQNPKSECVHGWMMAYNY